MGAFVSALPGQISRNLLTRYGAAFIVTVLALLARLALRTTVGDSFPYLTLLPAVAFSACLCGIGPSVLAMVLGVLGERNLLIAPERSLTLAGTSEWIGLLAYTLACAVIIAVGEAIRRDNETIRQAQFDLEERVHERTAELAAANGSLRELTARLLKSQDDERRRLARELHDSVGQTLAALAMNLSSVGADIERMLQSARTVGDSVALVNDMSTDIRTISYLLHPPLLDESGLSSALRWYVEGFVERSGIKVDLELPDAFARPPRDFETALFRVVQECLTNIHRHSASPVARIRVSSSAKEIRVEVEDSGKGIPDEKRQEILSSGLSGMGLRGMRERLRQLGGSLEVSPGKGGHGTLVAANLPLHEETEEVAAAAAAGSAR